MSSAPGPEFRGNDRFAVRRVLGEGGMGIVYEAYDRARAMAVALKTLRKLDAQALYYFKNEFRALADIAHPNLITLYELFSGDGQWFFTMELVAGESFIRYVRIPDSAAGRPTDDGAGDDAPRSTPRTISYDGGGQATPSATRIGWSAPAGENATRGATRAPRTTADRAADASAPSPGAVRPGRAAAYDEYRLRDALGQLASGLQALHDAGKIHRDIKPSNILVTPSGQVVIMDFGLAADEHLLEELATTRQIAGTPSYMAPEQARGGRVLTPAADWYAVGAMLYQVLTGRLPHIAANVHALLEVKQSKPVVPPSRIDPDVAPDLERLCLDLLRRDPLERPDGVEVMARLGVGGASERGEATALSGERTRGAGPVFVGRRRELAALRGHFATSAGGRSASAVRAAVAAAGEVPADAARGPVAVFVEGVSGIGKSALVDRFLDRVAADGALTLEGRCYAEESVPYKAFDGIVDALSRHLVTADAARLAALLPDDAALVGRLFPALLRVPAVAARNRAAAPVTARDPGPAGSSALAPSGTDATIADPRDPAALSRPASESAESATGTTAAASPAATTVTVDPDDPTVAVDPAATAVAVDPSGDVDDAPGAPTVPTAPTAVATSGRAVREPDSPGRDPGANQARSAAPDISPQELRGRAFAALLAMFARLADERPLVLAIDDLQWADADSLLLLRALLDPELGPPALLCASVRLGTGMAGPDGEGPLSPLPAHRLRLEPLTDEDAAALADVLLPADAGAGDLAHAHGDASTRAGNRGELARILAREAGGHPLFLSELARHRAEAGESGSMARLDDALWARVTRLEPDARRLVETVAIAGAPLPARVIAHAAGLDPAACAKLAARLRAASLLKRSRASVSEGTAFSDPDEPHGDESRGLDAPDDGLEPYHDRVRESVLGHLSPEQRAAGSARLADALLRAGAGQTAPEVVVRHLVAAGHSGRVGALAERAAERALRALAFDRAAEFFRIALDADARAHGAGAYRLHVALGEALAAGGRGSEAADAFLAAAESLADGADVAATPTSAATPASAASLDCRRRAAEQLLASGHVTRGLDLLSAVLAELGVRVPDTPDDALASMQEHRRGLAGQLASTRDGADLVASAPAAAAAVREADTFQAISIGLILVDNVRGADFQARAVVAALRVGDPRRIVRALVFEAIYRAQEGHDGRAEAEALFEVARRIADDAARDPGDASAAGGPRDDGRDSWMDAYLVLARAFFAYYYGRYRDAVVRFRDAAERFRWLSGVAWEQNTIRLHILRAIDYQGAWGELRTLYHEYLRDALRRDDRYVEASISRWFNVLWLAHDDPDRAGADLDRTVWTSPESGCYHLQDFLELRARVELALYRGEGAAQGAWARPGLDAAERSLLLRIQVARAIADWLRGRIAACEAAAVGDASTGQGRSAAAEVDAAAAALEAQDIGYARIWAGLLRGAVQALRGDRDVAIAGLEATAELADGHDFPLCAAIARLRAGQLAGPAGEARIADAVAWMRGQDIHDPLRMAEVFAPGYPIG